MKQPTHLAESSRGSVLVLDDLVVEGSSHADGSTGEVRVKVLHRINLVE